MVDESVKFAWAFLLLHGQITNGEWSYYGSNWEFPTNTYGSFEKYEKELVKIREQAVFVGIDWEKSGLPEVHDEVGFNGTFESGSNCLATLGKLVLKNGKKCLIGTSNRDAAHLVETAKKMLEKKSSPVTELAEKL